MKQKSVSRAKGYQTRVSVGQSLCIPPDRLVKYRRLGTSIGERVTVIPCTVDSVSPSEWEFWS